MARAPGTPISKVALPARALGRAVENLVDLSRHDEVILVQSLYFLSLQADRRIAPAEADVRMMAFGLSEFTDLLDKGPCFAKVAEPEGPLDTMSVVAEFPVRGLRTAAFGFLMSEWWDATTAGRACLLGKSFGHLSLSLIKLFARTMPTQNIYRSCHGHSFRICPGQLFDPTC